MSKIALFKNIFSVFGLLFFTSTLKFDSLFNVYDGITGTFVLVKQPLAGALSLIQHTIFIVVLFFLFEQRKNIIQSFTRNIFLWFLIAIVLGSFLWSDFPDVTLPRSLSFLETSLFGLYLAANYNLKTQVRLIAWALAISMIINILFTLAFPSRAVDWVIHYGALKGVFVQKNLFARLLVLGGITFLVTKPKTKKNQYLVWGFLILSVALIILAQSKSALLIFFLIAIILIIINLSNLSELIAIPSLLTLFVVVSSFIFWLILNLEDTLTAVGRDITLSGRTIIWSAILDKIQERPLLGYGYLGFWRGIRGDSAYVGKVMGNTYTPPHAHNGFLELTLAFGLIGTVFFVLSFLLIIRRAIIAAKLKTIKEELFPSLYISFLIFYNLVEPTLIEHNSIYWVLYVSLASTRFLTLEKSPPKSRSFPSTTTAKVYSQGEKLKCPN